MRQNSELDKSMEEEIERRIKIMESSTYKNVPALNRNDVIGMAAVGVVCIIGLIWGVM